MTDRGRSTAAFRLVLGLFLLYGGLSIARTSFLVEGERYFMLADDQFISMRYAENLARGHGLVWNAGGARVEGYTNFLWVLFMSIFHKLGIARPVISVTIQIAGLFLLAATLFIVRRIGDHLAPEEPAVGVTAAAMTAFYYPLLNWALLGTEVSLLTLLVTAAVWLALTIVQVPRRSWFLYLALGCSTLVRPDMLITAAAVLFALLWVQPSANLRRVIVGGAVVSAFVLAATLGRIVYFGDPLPNTYYLKMSGFPVLPRLSRGALVSAALALESAPLVLAICIGRPWRSGQAAMQALVAVVAGQLVYNLVVGGDAWEDTGGTNRFVAIVWPLCTVMAGVGLKRAGLFGIRAAAAVVAGLIILTSYLAIGLSNSDPLQRLLLLRKSLAFEEDERHVREGLAVRRFTDDQAVIGVVAAGAIPYFSERPALDFLGKTDAKIAHERMHVPSGAMRWLGFVPGHLKWDFEYSIGTLRPDVIQAMRPGVIEAALRRGEPTSPAEAYLRGDYVFVNGWYVRRDSPHIRWDVLGHRPSANADNPRQNP